MQKLNMQKLSGPKKLGMKKLSGPRKLSLRGAHTTSRGIVGTNYSYFKKGPTKRIGAPRAKIKQIRKVGSHLR
jgi:hypothetical protein